MKIREILLLHPVPQEDMTKEITATEAGRKFSELLNRVRYAGESFVVVRNGEAVCRIEPADRGSASVEDLLAVLTNSGPVDDSFADDLEKTQRDQPTLPDSPWDS